MFCPLFTSLQGELRVEFSVVAIRKFQMPRRFADELDPDVLRQAQNCSLGRRCPQRVDFLLQWKTVQKLMRVLRGARHILSHGSPDMQWEPGKGLAPFLDRDRRVKLWAFEADDFACTDPDPACSLCAALSFNIFLFSLKEHPLNPALPDFVFYNFASLVEALCCTIASETGEDLEEAFSFSFFDPPSEDEEDFIFY